MKDLEPVEQSGVVDTSFGNHKKLSFLYDNDFRIYFDIRF